MSTLLTLGLTLLTATTAPVVGTPEHGPPAPTSIIAAWVRGGTAAQAAPRINLWLNRDDVYRRGDRARVYFRSDEDAYVTVVRIDTDGRVRVLFPIDPWEDNYARGGRTFEVIGRDRDEAFRVDDYPGLGYVFAIASDEPFSYDDVVRGDHWDYRQISEGRVRGDPYVAVSDLAERIAPEGGYDYDVASYSVENHYDYPRFVCYDCHTYAAWRYWDPYHSSCSRFRIVIYDDWYYYPYRQYRGGVVVVRPYRPGPRYVFKDYDGRNDYVTRVANRNRGDDGRTVDRGRTSADFGGRGSIPAPVSPRRRAPETGAQPSRRTTPGAEPNRAPETRNSPNRRTTPEAEPNRSPETRQPSDQPRDRAEPPRDQGPSRNGRPDQGSPRRRPSNDGSPGGLRDTETAPPERGTAGSPNRRGSDAPSAQPERSRPREQGGSREAPRSEPRPAPERRGGNDPQPRVQQSPPERSAPRAEPQRSQPPRSTGSPELRRRRPNT